MLPSQTITLANFPLQEEDLFDESQNARTLIMGGNDSCDGSVLHDIGEDRHCMVRDLYI
jgi:hypothetical protein